MAAATTQVNVRLAPDELEVVDQLRRSAGSEISRAEVLRSLVRQRRRSVLDEQIAAAYDATGPHDDDDIARASVAMSGKTLKDL